MKKAKVITVSSGKGGVGKSSTATNLALSLSALDKKVCIFDADASLANINILLGIQPKFTLQHLLNGEKTLNDITIKGPRGLRIIPGASGVAEYAHLSGEQKSTLLSALDRLQQQYDYLIIDTAAGIGDDVLDFVRAAQFSIIIITPEPTSLTDSFSLLKVLKRSNYQQTSHVLVNMAQDYSSSKSIYKRFETAVKKYIDAKISYLGYIQADETMISSVSLQCPAVLLNPDAHASRCFEKLAIGIENQQQDDSAESFSDFWRQQDNVNTTNKPSLSSASTVASIEKPRTEKSADINFTQAAAFCVEQLAEQQLSDDQQADFLKAIKPYLNINQTSNDSSSVRDFYHYLEKNSFPKNEVQEVINTLEQVYRERYNEPLDSIEAATLKLLAQFNGDEDSLRYVHTQISNSFQRQFKQPLVEFSEHIKSFSETENRSKASFDSAVEDLLSAYQQTLSAPYKTQADKDLELANQAIQAQNEQQRKLTEQLNQSQQLLAEKTAVLNKIQQLLPQDTTQP